MSKAEEILNHDEELRTEESQEEEEEVEVLSNLMAEKLLTSCEEAAKATIEPPKPFAAFGSYRQRHGEFESPIPKSCEAPAKLGIQQQPQQDLDEESRSSSSPVAIPRPASDKLGARLMRRRAMRNRELEREEAWERKRGQHQQEEVENRQARAVGRSVSDCGLSRTGSGSFTLGKSRFRARSLTDEDLDELRGSIDLGFGFSNQADPELWNTLPALELCWAINQQYQNKGSPVSSTDDGTLSEGSPTSSWTISSPGDHPHQVKTRLRHWAQAVACTIRQNYQQELC